MIEQYGHALHVGSNKIPSEAQKVKTMIKQPQGRQETTWTEQVSDHIKREKRMGEILFFKIVHPCEMSTGASDYEAAK
jgi:hypothetical protein